MSSFQLSFGLSKLLWLVLIILVWFLIQRLFTIFSFSLILNLLFKSMVFIVLLYFVSRETIIIFLEWSASSTINQNHLHVIEWSNCLIYVIAIEMVLKFYSRSLLDKYLILSLLGIFIYDKLYQGTYYSFLFDMFLLGL